MSRLSKIILPHTLVIISGLILFVGVLTWIVPSGEYDRTVKEGRTIVVADTYQSVPRSGQSIGVLLAPFKGFLQAAEIIGFVLFVGGSINLIQRTGAVESGLRVASRLVAQSPSLRTLAIPILMTLFSLGGATFGMSEEVLAFILIFIPLARSLGYDSIVGVAIPFVGATSGFAGAFLNPFTVGIAQGISDLPIFSGLPYRLFVWAVVTGVAVAFVMRYARRILNEPESSPVYDIDQRRETRPEGRHEGETTRFSRRDVLVNLTVVAAFVLLIVGVMQFEWHIVEMSGLFLGMGIVGGIVGRLRIGEIATAFIDGAKEMVAAAFMIGFARGVLIVASDGKIIDTIMYALSGGVQQFHPIVSAHMMFVVQTIINLFIPSGSGQAALSMPIMAPLSDLVGITRQTAVLAFQLGDGFTNMITPTSGVLMGILGIAKIPWERWALWILPLQVLFAIVALLLLIPPVMMEWGPF